MSWRPSYEGRACDAVLRHIEARIGSARQNLRSPERDHHAAPVDLACELNGVTYAIEHTAIEAFAGQIRNDVNFDRQLTAISTRLGEHVPGNERWDVTIPIGAMPAVPSGDLARAQEAVVSSILAVAPAVNAPPWGTTINRPTELGPSDGAPFVFLFKRYVIGDSDTTTLAGVLITRSVGPLEHERADRMRKVCVAKFPKLQTWRESGARTILVLESNDLIITNVEAVATAYLAAESERADLPDEVYFLHVTEGEVSSPWLLSAIRIDDRDYRELSLTENHFEIDPSELHDITARQSANA